MFVVIVFALIDAVRTDYAIENELDRIRAREHPVTGAELNALYHSDQESDRLGREYAQTFQLYDSMYEKEGEIHYVERLARIGEVPDVEALQHMRRHLDANLLYMSRMHELVRVDHEVRFLMDLSKGFETRFPHLADIRNAVRMGAIQTQVALAEGDTEAAASSLFDMILLVELLRYDPLLIPQLVRFACHAIARDCIEYAANAQELSLDEWTRIQSLLDGVVIDGAVRLGLIGETTLNATMKLTDDYSEVLVKGWLTNFSPLAFNYLGPKWRLSLLRDVARVYEIGSLPPWQRVDAGRQLTDLVNRRWPVFHLFSQITIPANVRAYEAEVRAMAHVETTRAGVAVLRFVLEHGHLPKQLSELVPRYIGGLPIDAFDGEPLRYRQTETGYVVYSIAHNLKDDGGMPPSEGKRVLEEGDIVFRVLDASPYLRQNDAP